MAWVKLDDRFHAHPKLAALGKMTLPAVGLHILAMTWCADYETDGDIPEGQVARLGGTKRLAAALVAADLWESSEGGYRVHDFLEYNPSHAYLLAERAKKATAGRQGGLRSGEVRRSRDDAAGKQGRTGNEADGEQEVELAPSTVQRKVSGDRTPEPEPEPVARPLKERKRTRDGLDRRPDIDALSQRQGLVTAAQVRVLDEILQRHDVSGPRWAAEIISRSPPTEDALAALMAADRTWQADRRAGVANDEQRWATMRADEGAAAAAFDWAGLMSNVRRSRDLA